MPMTERNDAPRASPTACAAPSSASPRGIATAGRSGWRCVSPRASPSGRVRCRRRLRAVQGLDAKRGLRHGPVTGGVLRLAVEEGRSSRDAASRVHRDWAGTRPGATPRTGSRHSPCPRRSRMGTSTPVPGRRRRSRTAIPWRPMPPRGRCALSRADPRRAASPQPATVRPAAAGRRSRQP
jgi:hypothetical protein